MDRMDTEKATSAGAEMTQGEWRAALAAKFEDKRIPAIPCVIGPGGLRLDFCWGLRLLIPPTPSARRYLVRMVDLDSGLVIDEVTLAADEYYVSPRKLFVRWCVQVTDANTGERLWQHKFDASGRDVLVRIPVHTLGDTLAWMRGVLDFGEREKCRLHVRVEDYIRPLLEPASPNVRFVSDAECADISPYAAYTVAVFTGEGWRNSTAADYRTIPLHHVPAYILNVPPSDEPPPVWHPPMDGEECRDAIPSGRYAAIATMASGGVKLWHHAEGWDRVVDFIRSGGLQVADIDKEPLISCRYYHHRIPRGAIDLTGDIPLTVRAAQIAGAEFFVGLGSGLSWLAWCLRKPIVLIGGFSEPWEEFPTPWRVRNPLTCHGCFNDASIVFDNRDFFWCPRHANTDRHWECSRGITPKMVIDAIRTVPTFSKERTDNGNGEQ